MHKEIVWALGHLISLLSTAANHCKLSAAAGPLLHIEKPVHKKCKRNFRDLNIDIFSQTNFIVICSPVTYRTHPKVWNKIIFLLIKSCSLQLQCPQRSLPFTSDWSIRNGGLGKMTIANAGIIVDIVITLLLYKSLMIISYDVSTMYAYYFRINQDIFNYILIVIFSSLFSKALFIIQLCSK